MEVPNSHKKKSNNLILVFAPCDLPRKLALLKIDSKWIDWKSSFSNSIIQTGELQKSSADSGSYNGARMV